MAPFSFPFLCTHYKHSNIHICLPVSFTGMRGPKWDTLNLSNDGLSKEFNTWPLIPGILSITSELFSVLHEGCKKSSRGSDPTEKIDTFNNWHQYLIFFRVKIFKLKILDSNKEGNWKNRGTSFFLKITEKCIFHTIHYPSPLCPCTCKITFL